MNVRVGILSLEGGFQVWWRDHVEPDKRNMQAMSAVSCIPSSAVILPRPLTFGGVMAGCAVLSIRAQFHRMLGGSKERTIF